MMSIAVKTTGCSIVCRVVCRL